MKFVSHLDGHFLFPPVDEADEEGLLVIGGRLSPARIIEAYKKGIFPWYCVGEPVLWWSPDPRFVLFPSELHVSNSMRKSLRKTKMELRINTSFEEVINACALVNRKGQEGTWITDEMKAAYIELYHMGYAHSAETWLDGKLVGGMYGILLNKVFFGESMFSKTDNASKFAFIQYVQQLQEQGIKLIDCQVYSDHVATLGARLIPRHNFIQLLNKLSIQ